MASPYGAFVWYELLTTDTAAAKIFYGKVIGWGAQPSPVPGVAYTLFAAGEIPVSGLMDLPDSARQMGAPPHWIGYVGVEDVDTTAERVKRLGGNVVVAAEDIPEVGRLAVVTDPQGAAFALFRWKTPRQSAPAAPGTPGHAGWHELMAVDWEKAFAFYGELFGWQKADAIDIGPMGTYQLFSAGGPPIGGMFNKPAPVPRPFWLYYFNIAGIDAAAGRVTAAGGQIANGPMQVPGGSWIVQCKDPQGVMFAMVGPQS
jgi:predicted enzyme related to lactoylglutathione lyase